MKSLRAGLAAALILILTTGRGPRHIAAGR